MKLRQTYLSKCLEKIARDESGLSTTKYLETLCACGKITAAEVDDYFKEAERIVWIDVKPRKRQPRAYRREAA